MGKLAVKGKKETIEMTTVLQNDVMRAKLQSYVDEILRCKTKILDEQESIKQIRDAAIEELNIEGKMLNSIVSLYFNNDFDQKADELEKLQQVIDLLTKNR